MDKVAIIELNVEGFSFSVIDVKPGGFFFVENKIEEPVSIFPDIESVGLIKPNTIKDCINILKMFRKLVENYKISKVYTYGGSYLKDAKNINSFIDEIYNNCAFNLQVLSEEEENMAIYSGIVNTIDVPKGVFLYIDNLSTKVVSYNRRNVLSSNTIPFGCVSLAQVFENESDPKIAFKKMVDLINSEMSKFEIPVLGDAEYGFIGAGETLLSLGRLARRLTKSSLDLENNYSVSKEVTDSVINFFVGLGADKTKKIKGISEGRADYVLAGLAIVKSFLFKTNADAISIAENGFSEGLIYNNIVPEVNDKPLSDLIGYSLENIRNFYDDGYSNTSYVLNLALILFKQLKVIHKLHRYYVKPLRIASSMYNCGKRIDYKNQTNNGFDVILNSRIYGASQREILLAAFICKCQNLDEFSLSDWIKYKDIVSDEDLDAVRKLGVIVKLASSLDVSMSGVVKDISCDILGDSVIMKTILEGNGSFEIMEALKLGSDFKKVFKKYLEVI